MNFIKKNLFKLILLIFFLLSYVPMVVTGILYFNGTIDYIVASLIILVYYVILFRQELSLFRLLTIIATYMALIFLYYDKISYSYNILLLAYCLLVFIFTMVNIFKILTAILISILLLALGIFLMKYQETVLFLYIIIYITIIILILLKKFVFNLLSIIVIIISKDTYNSGMNNVSDIFSNLFNNIPSDNVIKKFPYNINFVVISLIIISTFILYFTGIISIYSGVIIILSYRIIILLLALLYKYYGLLLNLLFDISAIVSMSFAIKGNIQIAYYILLFSIVFLFLFNICCAIMNYVYLYKLIKKKTSIEDMVHGNEMWLVQISKINYNKKEAVSYFIMLSLGIFFINNISLGMQILSIYIAILGITVLLGIIIMNIIANRKNKQKDMELKEKVL